MLHRNVLMADIDVDQWRNAQYLVLESAKQQRRCVVIHDKGAVVKIRHSHGVAIVDPVTRVDDPHQVARALYEANRESVDFVAVFEREAFDSYFAEVQDSWQIDEDLDVFVTRTYALLDEFAEGMVTYPGPARSTLGLQWRLGASHDDVVAAVRAFVAPNSTVVLGVVDGNQLWTSLVLRFDAELSVVSITTADPSRVGIDGTLAELAARMVSWAATDSAPCSLGLFVDLEGARELTSASHKVGVLQRLAADGRLLIQPAPEGLLD